MSENEKEITALIVRSISHLERHRRKYINDNLRDKNLRGSMFLALIYLDSNPGSSQDKLCSELIIDKGNAARLCRQLEEGGYIRREQSPEDRRQNMLYLTDLGQEKIPGIRRSLSEWRLAATKDLTQEELETLISILLRMSDNIAGLE